jgi:beta-N-acetylglucosaminidase
MSIIPNIKFPIPKSAQGTSFSHTEDILNHLRGEHSGQWLISRSSLFHGGIHISSATTPWCALRGNDVDEPGTGIKGRGEQALICMADGEVVAYRICKDYLKAPWFTGPLSYSGSFVLIKHKVMPGETESSQLTFYTLYMHLAPWTAYQSADTSRFIINEKSGLRAYLDESHEICAGVLPKGTRVIWDGKTTRSFNKRDYAQITLEDDVTGMDWDASAGSQLWVLADHGSSNLKPVEVALPAWWKPLEQPMPVLDAMKFDQVVNLNTPLAIKAGDAIGHMGYFEDAYDQGKESDYRVHIECFTDDERLKTFLTNPEHVKTGEQFLKIVPGLTRTARAPKPPAPEEPEKEGKKSKKAKKKSTPQLWVFTAIDGKTTSTWCLPVSKLPAACPDESGKKYYRIDQESCWIAESDMTPVHQYDLEARGFNAIESSAGDVILHMNGQDKPSDFVSQLLNILKEAAKQYLGVDAALIPDSYQRILNWINGYDGKQWYDTNIIRNAIHYTMLNPQLNMLIVKHPSEWFYKSGSAIWNKPLKDMTDFDPQHATLNKSLIDSLSWMAEVKSIKGNSGVWHMHPVVFLNALMEKEKRVVEYAYYDLTLDQAVDKQMQLTGPSAPKIGNTIIASRSDVRSYVDPENHMNGDDFYQYLDLSAPLGISETEMNNFLSGKGVFDGKASVFIEAGKKYNISEAYLVAHALLETGNGTSRFAVGKTYEGKTVHNMYGIGVSDARPQDGAKLAYARKWFTVDAAIDGGAQWISNQFINNPTYKQNTLYKMRWNPQSPASHQYASDITWTKQQGEKIKSRYDLFPNSTLYFEVPVYNKENSNK